MVITKALVERGFSFPPSDFFSEILNAYGLQPHNISPNSVLAISNHVTLCEGHLRVTPELPLFQYYFTVKKEKIRQTSELATCGSITFMLRPGRVYPHTDRHESARYWSGSFFYLKDVSDPASDRKLPLFKNSPASETPAWTQCPHLSESPLLTRAVRRICKLTEEGLSGKDLAMSWFTKRIQPLQHRDRLMFHYTGRDDPMRATKDNLSADAIDKRIRLLIKIPRELHVHVCNKDIHSNGSGTAASSELSSESHIQGTTTRKPHLRRKFPMRLTKRKKAAPSSPAAKRAREAPSIAATRKAEAEKKRLKLIDTSNPKAPEAKPPGSRRKKVKPSPASIPVTPEVEVPPKASSAAKSDPKDVINVDDLPEDPIVGSDKGNSGKGASSSAPPPEQPTTTSTEVPTDLVEQKLRLSGATGTPQTHPHFFPILQKVPLSQRHAEISQMMEQVWGPANTEEKELNELEGGIKAFFAKHKDVRQHTRKLHEDLRTHVLEQKQEIELLQTRDADNQKAIALLETRIKGFEASLGFEWTKETALKRTEVYEEVQSSIDNLFEACRGVAKSLSLKRAETAVIDTMTKLIKQVPELIKDWQESSARGVASLVLVTCKAHFPTMNFADHDLPAGFSDAEDEDEEDLPGNDFAEEGSGSSADHDEEGSGDDSGDGSAYIASDEDQSSE
ncbi:hypothetical protein QYE76_042552 [Lolium multiflorum]|uniref:Transposase (putative) gypsy type domain-containing protein n=1 Tax=Lolium multiflorum TaxID=4521 RepID=A0AAD8TH65_LOLMU|nr:hypothetical protein QYE76_042552 [Lolium multiflorum]